MKKEENKNAPFLIGLVLLAAIVLFGYFTYKFAEKTTETLNIHFKTMDDILNENS